VNRCDSPTRKELEAEARRLNISGRSKMGKADLKRAECRLQIAETADRDCGLRTADRGLRTADWSAHQPAAVHQQCLAGDEGACV
jgi:hypothetical protein